VNSASPLPSTWGTGHKILIWTFLILVALSVIVPLLPEQALHYGGSDTAKTFFFRIVIELALPFYLALLVVTPEMRPHLKSPVTMSLLGFWLINFVCTFTGVNPALSFWGNLEHMGGVFQLTHLLLLYFYVLLICRLGNRWRDLLLTLALVAAVLVAANGILGGLGVPTPTHELSSPRIGSTLYNPDYLGAYLVVPLFIAAFLALTSNRQMARVLYASADIVVAVALYMSGTRGALVGLVIGALVAALIFLRLTSRTTLKRVGFGVILAGLATVVALFALSSHLPSGSVLHRVFTLGDDDTRSRLLNWGIALKGYPAHPIFGVGPENYYYVSNLYYNPSIYPYDPSYLARPHNYFLELLDTAGPLSVVLYLAVVAFAARAVARAYRASRVGLAGFTVLIGALVAYPVQMATLFTTVSGDLMFFALLGIACHLGEATVATASAADTAPVPSTDAAETARRSRGSPPVAQRWAWFTAILAGAAAVSAVYFANISPWQAATSTAHAEAISSSDPVQAAADYDQAMAVATNFDRSDLALSFADFASNLAESAGTGDLQQLAQQELNISISLSTEITTQDPTNARNWIDLANDFVAQAIASNVGGSLGAAQSALAQATQLEPSRPEPQLLQSDILIFENQLPAAETQLRQLTATFPTIERAAQRLSGVLQLEGHTADAVFWLERAEKLGYVPPNLASAQWAGDYYAQAGQYAKEVALYQAMLHAHPNDLDTAVVLVNAYSKDGMRDAALNLYQRIVAVDPSRAQEMPGVSPGP